MGRVLTFTLKETRPRGHSPHDTEGKLRPRKGPGRVRVLTVSKQCSEQEQLSLLMPRREFALETATWEAQIFRTLVQASV